MGPFIKVKATGHVGVYWEGVDYPLGEGPHWLMYLRVRWHLFRYPYRRVQIERLRPKASKESLPCGG